MKNTFRSASGLHHKKVLVLNTRLGLGFEIKVLVLKNRLDYVTAIIITEIVTICAETNELVDNNHN